MKGYKVFNPDWTCRDFQYEVGKTYEMEGEPSCCDRGFHFCTDLKDCFGYHKFAPDNKVAIIEALGAIDTEGNKSCTNKITIVKEITWEEVLHLVNTGKGCSGLGNSGDYNSGDYNSGYYNSGYRNSGNYNSGNYNSGNYNSGDYNSGNWNNGYYNSGNWNSGDWNKTSFSSGVFNTKEGKILMFNKPSDWTYRDWLNSKARFLLLNRIEHNLLKWVWSENMTDIEKKQHPEHTTTGGYLKSLDKSERAQKWWDTLNDKDKNVIKSLPNFDAKIFEEITGIKVE